MIKTFIFGILLGMAAAAGALYALPAVDQHREVSMISVSVNGGTTELFHVNIPTDRVMVGGPDRMHLPSGLQWPQDEIFSGLSAEIFKIRNARDTVVGVAARTVAKEGEADVLDWTIHLPARGSMYVNMDPVPREGGFRMGQLSSGSREFQALSGFVSERWVPDTSGEEDAPAGRIELVATYIGTAEPSE